MTTLKLTEQQIAILNNLTNLYDEINKSDEGQRIRDDIMGFSRDIQKQTQEEN